MADTCGNVSILIAVCVQTTNRCSRVLDPDGGFAAASRRCLRSWG